LGGGLVADLADLVSRAAATAGIASIVFCTRREYNLPQDFLI
jgi:hypothetical protein